MGADERGETRLVKRDAVLKVLDKGVAMIHLDPRVDGVSVPEFLAVDPVVRLNFAYGFNLSNFCIDEEGIGAVLNFNGPRHSCWVPWDAVFSVTAPDFDHDGVLWPTSVPRELWPQLMATLQQARAQEQESEEEGGAAGAEVKPGPQLRLVDGEPDVAEEADLSLPAPVEPSPAKPGDGKPFLRLVKDDS